MTRRGQPLGKMGCCMSSPLKTLVRVIFITPNTGAVVPPLKIFFLERIDTPTGRMLIVTDDEQRLRAVDWEDHEQRMHKLLRRRRSDSTARDVELLRRTARASGIFRREYGHPIIAVSVRSVDSAAIRAGLPGDSHLRRFIDDLFCRFGRFAEDGGDLRRRQCWPQTLAGPVPHGSRTD